MKTRRRGPGLAVLLLLLPIVVGVSARRADASDHCDDSCDYEPGGFSCSAGSDHQRCLDDCYAQYPRYPSYGGSSSSSSTSPPPPAPSGFDDAGASSSGEGSAEFPGDAGAAAGDL